MKGTRVFLATITLMATGYLGWYCYSYFQSKPKTIAVGEAQNLIKREFTREEALESLAFLEKKGKLSFESETSKRVISADALPLGITQTLPFVPYLGMGTLLEKADSETGLYRIRYAVSMPFPEYSALITSVFNNKERGGIISYLKQTLAAVMEVETGAYTIRISQSAIDPQATETVILVREKQ